MKKIMRFFIFIFSCILLFTVAADAVVYSDSVYPVLHLTGSAEAEALASAGISTVRGLNGVFYNPAGLGSVRTRSASLSVFQGFMGTQVFSAAYAQDLGSLTLALQVSSLLNDGFREISLMGELLDNKLGVSEILISTTAAFNVIHPPYGLDMGISVKMVSSRLDTSRSAAIILDGGFQTPLLPLKGMEKDSVRFGFYIRNIHIPLGSYSDTPDILLPQLRGGLNVRIFELPLHTLNAMADAGMLIKDTLFDAAFGVEYGLGGILKIRSGWLTGSRHSGLSAGLGLKKELVSGHLSLDYSLSPPAQSLSPGILHRISLVFDF